MHRLFLPLLAVLVVSGCSKPSHYIDHVAVDKLFTQMVRWSMRPTGDTGNFTIDFGDGTVGYATDGTPVDCVRFGRLGLVEGFRGDVLVWLALDGRARPPAR